MLLLITSQALSAGAILGDNLSTFALLGGAGVTVAGTGSTVVGSVGGCCNATAVTGYPAGFGDSGGTVFDTGILPATIETLAQSELGDAITGLSGMTPASNLASLNATIVPGVYSVSATTLAGTTTLDGGGNQNALWVFVLSSSLTTASSSDVIVQNTGAGAGVYWVTTSGSVTLGSNSTFEGNVLANGAITVDPSATDSCGRLLTQTASVTLAGSDTIGINCTGELAASGGLGGGGTLAFVNQVPTVTPLSFALVPEPSTMFLMVTGLVALTLRLRMIRTRQTIRVESANLPA